MGRGGRYGVRQPTPREPLPTLVIGAGPTGLALACALAQESVACRVIERRERPSERSKANLINPRTIEVLAELGIGERLLAEGIPIVRTRIARGTRVVAEFGTPPFPQTRYPFALHIPQPQLEDLLLQRLQELGVAVERGVELQAVRQGRDSVVARLAGPAGPEECRAAYLVGCDGANSTVRQCLGLSFSGQAYPESFIVADIQADWTLPLATNLMWLHRDGVLLAWACRAPGLWHFFFNLTAAQDATITAPTLDDVRRIVSERTGDRRVALDRPVWISKFGVQRRQVGQYRVGRIFLAGDAAHIHSPMVGKGLGIGIQDGASLGTAIANAQGEARDISLLDAYWRERMPVTRQVFRESHATHRLLIPRGPASRRVRDTLAPLLRLGPAQRALLRSNFQLEGR